MTEKRAALVDKLVHSEEPSIRWKIRTRVFGEDPDPSLQEEIRNSPRVQTLLGGRDKHFAREPNVYATFRGAHWTLAALAEIGYPAGDKSLLPMREQVLDVWLSERFYKEFESPHSVPKSRGVEGVPRIQGRYRRCGSQQGNALYSMTRLGLADHRAEQLVERLLHWQWPDGGWNCDRKPTATRSSFMETLLPMLSLAPYNREAALRAAEVFLTRRLFRRRTDGRIISPNFLTHHYPRYWHYDLLGGLVAMAELGLIGDPRCAEALDRLEAKELPGGGWAAEGKFYKVVDSIDTSEVFGATSPVGWGSVGRTRPNEWISADALFVLGAAGRL